MLDYLIQNAKVFDGDSFLEKQNLGIREGKIFYLGADTPESQTTIDAKGKILSPTFVDTHNHADFHCMEKDNDGRSSLSQGVGTLVVGNCGLSTTPKTAVCPVLLPEPHDTNVDLDEHLHRFKQPLPLHIGDLLGHGTLRVAVIGEAREANAREIDEMKAKLEAHLENGGMGMSVGLNYPEAHGYNENELYECCKVLAKFSRPLTCHIRDQGAGILDAMDEVIRVGEKAGCSVLISHLRPISDRFDHLLDDIKKRIVENDHVAIDMYPYSAGSTSIAWFFEHSFHQLPKEENTFTAKDVDDAIRAVCIYSYADIHILRHKNPSYEKQTVESVAKKIGIEPGYAAQRVYLEDPNCICIYAHQSSDWVVDDLIQLDDCMLGSDGWLYSSHYDGVCHPRSYAAFTGFLSRYVRTGIIPLEKGLRRLTSQAAKFFKLDNMGKISEGKPANLNLFDMDDLVERADFKNSTLISHGMNYVFINGEPVIKEGEFMGNLKLGKRVCPG